jgi:hypothetical protein
MPTIREYLAANCPTKAMIDRFLDARAYNWAKFDPVVGYTHADYSVRDGIDNCFTINRMDRDNARLSPSANGRPCRINTYGDSFTHCDQVSDGETWQEYLAAHLGEPIRNFGTGGHGVYQAWRRMEREESSPRGADHIILNLFEDDHRRSVMSWRYIDLWEGFFTRCREEAEGNTSEAAYFHNSPWDHLVWDLGRREFVERRSHCPKPADLYRICDADWLMESFRGDWFFHTAMAKKRVSGVDLELLRAHADSFGLRFDAKDPDALAASAGHAHTIIGLHSTLWVLDRARAFATERGKKLMFLLSYGAGGGMAAARGKPIEDSLVLDRLRALPEPHIDIRDHHAADFKDFACDVEAYSKRYWIGHYSPRGNHFFAYAIKDAVVRWLEPKPVAYRDSGRDVMAAMARMTGGATVGGAAGR